MTQRRTTTLRDLPGELLAEACLKFLGGMGAVDIVTWLRGRGFEINRQQSLPLLREAAHRGLLRVHPPADRDVAVNVADCFGRSPETIRVVPVDARSTLDLIAAAADLDKVAAAAADLIVLLIKELGSRRGKKWVHLGLGAGMTTMMIARILAERLRTEQSLPGLVLHALSQGFSVDQPNTAPVAMFGLFTGLPTEVRYVNYLGPLAAGAETRLENVTELPRVNESFAAAKDIDIVITSLASSKDEHGDLNQLMRHAKPDDVAALEEARHCGDVQFSPYSVDGPIDMDGRLRPMVILQLSDLVEMAKTRDKHVILVAGPCKQCDRTRADALRPLMRTAALAVWTHVVLCSRTAAEAIALERAAERRD